MAKLVKALKVTFTPKDISELTGKDFELSFNDDTQQTEIFENDQVVGIYNNGIPSEIEHEIVESVKGEEEYKVLDYYADALGKKIRRLIKPSKMKFGRNGLEIEFWVDL